jgi:hypothetical protein
MNKTIFLTLLPLAGFIAGCETSGPLVSGSTARTVTVESLSPARAADAAEAECAAKGAGLHARFVDVAGRRYVFNCG